MVLSLMKLHKNKRKQPEEVEIRPELPKKLEECKSTFRMDSNFRPRSTRKSNISSYPISSPTPLQDMSSFGLTNNIENLDEESKEHSEKI